MERLTNVEYFMEMEDGKKLRRELKKYMDIVNSPEYISKLLPKAQKVLKDADNYKALFNVDDERITFEEMDSGNSIGSSEIKIIDENGCEYFIAVSFIDELAEELTLFVSKEKSWWALYNQNCLTEEEEDESYLEDIETYCDYDKEGYEIYRETSDNADWLDSPYAPLFVVAIKKLATEFLNDKNECVSWIEYPLRFFYSRLWLRVLYPEEEMDIISEEVGCY